MKEFKIHYSFNAFATCSVFAKDQKEAEEKFYEGEFDDNKEQDGEDYEIDKIEEK